MAVREGFEPSLEFPLNTLSKRAPSTTRPSLQPFYVTSFCQGSWLRLQNLAADAEKTLKWKLHFTLAVAL